MTLNALVQFGALRLDTDRSFLSLIDGDFQYIVAEATRKQSLMQENASEDDDRLFLGVCKLDQHFGVCPNTMKAFTDETGTWVANGPNVVCDRTRYVINDFRADAHYLEKPYVSGWPHMVSYLEVPLTSPLGYVLGSYCVVDNRQRDFNDDKTVNIMAEIATAIMSHLDLVRTKEHRARSDQLIRGLGQLMERDSTIPGASVSESVDSARRMSEVGSLAGSCGAALMGTISKDDLTPESEARKRLSSCSQISSTSQVASPIAEISTTGSTEYLVSPTTAWTPPLSPSQMDEKDVFETFFVAPEATSSIDAVSTGGTNQNTPIPTPPSQEPAPSKSSVSSEVPPTSTSTTPSSGTDSHLSPISTEVKDTLSKAALTIRDAMEMDGVTFFDAVPSSFASRSAHPTPAEQGDDPFELGAANFFADDTKEVYCATLSQSVKSHGANEESSQPHLRMPEAMLQRFVRRYPRGHIFTADEFGPIDCRYGPGHAMRTIRKSQERTTQHRDDIRTLFSFVPEARYIMFLPLWHFQKECWFAAIFGHIIDPTIGMELADINLLTAFGNSVMVEVSRFEALAVSRAKSDFISSISHELRSPLHGIMASGELLRDSMADTQYLPLLDMIDSCSTTLLDTFDNLLDFAKINSAVRAQEKTEYASRRPKNAEFPIVDMGHLVEDMVETVQLGHITRTAFRPEQEGILTSIAELSNANEGLPDTSVLVTIKIEKRQTWLTRIDTGAWKRIIMNLFGNALKYTRSGHIEVSLSMVQRPGSTNQSRTYICFSVRDTGIGMSPEYIKYHMFTPFAQENTLSPGTGLGLSIVQQLTKSLGGEVDVKSLVGIGTQVTVLVPLMSENSGALSLQLPSILESTQIDPRRGLRGHSLCVITAEAYQAMSNTELDTTSEIRDRARALRAAIKYIANDFLGMKVTFATSTTALPAADVYFFDSYILGHPTLTKSNAPLPDCLRQATPMVVLCSGSGPLKSSESEETATRILHLRHPIGPKKLATALIRALEIGKEGPLPSPATPVVETVDKLSYFPFVLQEKPRATASPSIVATSPTALTPLSPLAESAISSPSMLHLLLVDDNPINLKILTTLVKKLNLSFATACNGLEAVHLFKASLHPSQRLFDVIFMDISMPVMNGFEATREIRKIERENGIGTASQSVPEGPSTSADNKATLSGCQIVALTGLGSETSRQEAFSSGTNMFLTKPVKLAEIKNVLSGTEERLVIKRQSLLAEEIETRRRGSTFSSLSSLVTLGKKHLSV
jgi:signal transduction histidine kinase/CheY-like chemotaxis protein